MSLNEFHISLTNFDKNFKKLIPKENHELYISFFEASDFYHEIKVVVKRIKTELTEFIKAEKIIFDIVKENEHDERIRKFALKAVKSFVKLRLDIKDFFIHTRIFLDILSRIIKLAFGTRGEQLPKSMSRLLNEKYKRALEIDKIFFEKFKMKMIWYNDFVDNGRDRIVHELGQLVFTNTREGKLGFDILKSFNSSWGTDTVNDVEDFIETTFKNLSEITNYLTDNLKFDIQQTKV